MKDHVAEYLQHCRLYAKLSQEKMAKLLGVSTRTLQNYEKEGNNLPFLTIFNYWNICRIESKRKNIKFNIPFLKILPVDNKNDLSLLDYKYEELVLILDTLNSLKNDFNFTNCPVMKEDEIYALKYLLNDSNFRSCLSCISSAFEKIKKTNKEFDESLENFRNASFKNSRNRDDKKIYQALYNGNMEKYFDKCETNEDSVYYELQKMARSIFKKVQDETQTDAVKKAVKDYIEIYGVEE